MVDQCHNDFYDFILCCPNLQSAILFLASTLNIPTFKRIIRNMQRMRWNIKSKLIIMRQNIKSKVIMTQRMRTRIEYLCSITSLRVIEHGTNLNQNPINFSKSKFTLASNLTLGEISSDLYRT